MSERDLLPLLHRIADALERLAPVREAISDLDAADAFVWHSDRDWCEPVPRVNRVPIGLLRGIDRVRDILLQNTERFAAGYPANNVLLWGASQNCSAHHSVRHVRPILRRSPPPRS